MVNTHIPRSMQLEISATAIMAKTRGGRCQVKGTKFEPVHLDIVQQLVNLETRGKYKHNFN